MENDYEGFEEGYAVDDDKYLDDCAEALSAIEGIDCDNIEEFATMLSGIFYYFGREKWNAIANLLED